MTLTRKISGGRRTRCKTLSKKKCLKRKTCTLGKKSRKCSKRRKMHRGGVSRNNHFTLRLKVLKNDKPVKNVATLPPSVKSSFMKYFKSEDEDGKFGNVAKPNEIKSVKFKGSSIIIKGSTQKPIDDEYHAYSDNEDADNEDADPKYDPMVFANEVRHLSQRLADDVIEHNGDNYEGSKLCIVGKAPADSNNEEAYCFK